MRNKALTLSEKQIFLAKVTRFNLPVEGLGGVADRTAAHAVFLALARERAAARRHSRDLQRIGGQD
jgi:hypothetical protein